MELVADQVSHPLAPRALVVRTRVLWLISFINPQWFTQEVISHESG